MANVCKCGKGYASDVDNMCKFCREEIVSRADARKVGVRHRGDGLTLEQWEQVKRNRNIYIEVRR